jgi:bifunctional DNA-binding transcriptional regulator/antitoxin component of YhaV-PrlF toxin-antitoxin module
MGNTNLTYYPRTYEAITSENNNDIDYKETVSKIREKVKLKEGYIPIGVKEHGDIIYIVSYNPEEKRTEIGSFPGPEYRPFDKIPSKEINKLVDINEKSLSKIYNLTEEGDTLLKPYDLISDYSMEGLSPMFISTSDNKGLYIPKYINVNTNQDITDSVNIIYNYNSNFNNYKIG